MAQGLLRANFGTFKIKAVVLGFAMDFELELALLRWAGIGEEAEANLQRHQTIDQ